MQHVYRQELGFKNRNEAIVFLKKLWREEATDCPLCGQKLEHLHRKAKKNCCDWQCKNCNKIYRTIHLLDEINTELPV